MKTVQELLIAICDDLQEYLNDTSITEMQIDVTTRLLELLKDFKVLYVDTDSVGCVPGYPEVRPDIYAPDPDDAEDKDAVDTLEDTLEDFDIDEIEKIMEQPTDYNSRKPFRPALMGIYKLAGSLSTSYQCIAINDIYHTCTMRNVKTGWTCEVYDVGIYNNYSIDWSHSKNGHFS